MVMDTIGSPGALIPAASCFLAKSTRSALLRSDRSFMIRKSSATCVPQSAALGCHSSIFVTCHSLRTALSAAVVGLYGKVLQGLSQSPAGPLGAVGVAAAAAG